jgi:hypothetical protein
MMRLHAVQAGEGDCFILEDEDGESSRFLLIDGGPANTYATHLEPALAQLGVKELALVLLSHVDNDHIVGLLDLFGNVQLQRERRSVSTLKIERVWHNAFSQTVGDEIARRVDCAIDDPARGIAEGSDLAGLVGSLNIPINPEFANGFVSIENERHRFCVGRTTLRVVGPNKEALQRLKGKWEAWLAKHADEIARGGRVSPDRSPTNCSSIVTLVESGKRRILLTGDATRKEILAGLESAGLLHARKPFHVDVLKVPHHGSNRNVDEEFFRKVTADSYLISANGRHGNPDLQTLLWIVDSAGKPPRHIHLWVTNVPDTVKQLMVERPPDQHGYELHPLPRASHFFTVQLTED